MPRKLSSFNITEDILNQLKQIIPEAFKDGFVDIGALNDALSDYSGDEILDIDENLFGLYWPGKRKAKRAAAIPPAETLVPVPGDGINEETTRNIYIEGDNLEVLKIIDKAYKGRIKMIYIDPPYNTGEDFIYNDDFSESTESYQRLTGQVDENSVKMITNKQSDGRFHSKWCSMMYPRLRLARDLLSDDGVIFISIDDNEIMQLLKICDEIFGEENFLVNNIWISGRTSSAHFTHSHEYVLGYAKNISSLPLFLYQGDTEIISERTIKKPGQKNPASIISFPSGIDFECEDKIFPENFGDNEPIEVVDGTFECQGRKLKFPVSLKAGWAMRDMIISWLEGETVIDQKGQKIKRFFFKKNGVLQYEKERGTIHPNSIIKDISTKNGTNEIVNLLGKPIFPYPKPTELIRHFTSTVCDSNSIILDFFSGSATTAHAVMKLNAEDGGKRQFIMVQLPEICEEKSEAAKAGFKNICEIGKERIRRAGKKVKEAGLNAKDIDTGFKVFRLASSSFKPVNPYTGTDAKELSDWFSGDPLVDNWKPENLITEVMLREGFPLDSTITVLDIYKKNLVYQVSSDSCGHSLIICFDKNIENDTIEKLDLGELNIFICLDSAVTDQVKARLDDKGRIITI
jgi:adenine-specific DNA-methyltransferase